MTVALDEDKFWTYEDYLELPDDGNRYEIIQGKLHMSPPPSTFHQTVSRRIQFVLYQLEQKGAGFIFNAPVGLKFDDVSHVEPDLVYLTAQQKHLIEKNFINGPPHLVVEILSPSTASKDRTLKLNLYAGAGVPYYWIVDPSARTFEAYELRDGFYSVKAALDSKQTYVAAEVEGVSLDLTEVFQGYGEL
jgi:Uma2 family endonuclease